MAKLKNFLPVLITLWLFSNLAFAGQTPSFSGKWNGFSKFLGAQYPIILDLNQEGLHIGGEVYSGTMDEQSFIRYKVKGLVDGNTLDLIGTDIIERQGVYGCVAKLELQLTLQEEQPTLEGKWKPNKVKGGCAFGASGPIYAVRVDDKLPETVINERASVDKEGEILINGLAEREYHALLIAVNNYEHSSVVDLDKPVSDAEGLRKVLVNNYTFREENITLLKDPSRAQILGEFGRLTKSLDEKDQLLVFFAGHGVWDDDLKQGYWLPANAEKDSRVNWISNSTIRDYVRSFDSKHTLLISDACFSGGLFKERDAFAYGKAMLEMYKLPSRKAITSGTLTTVPDQSVFMEYLLKGLEDNTEPLVNAEQLFYRLKLAVVNNSPNGQIPQYGVIRETNDQGGAFIFLRK